MINFANLSANLNLNISNFSQNLRRASQLSNGFAQTLGGGINAGLAEAVKKSKFEFKDVSRIVQGIIISKVFYSGLNQIRRCTGAVWEFSKELEYAKIAYANLFGNAELASEFINVLKDFAATTPFTFQESEAAAKRLLAYGIQYKNVMYVMQGVLAASSMQGNPQVIESVSRALGQIYTKGRLMNEEMRQLAEAGIPAYEILRAKLGLTQKQLQNLGREHIPASKAINALVDGMNERFGSVVTASSRTLKGIISNIKDNATMLFAGVMEPATNSMKVLLDALGKTLFKMREIFELRGLGGLFEEMVPPELHASMRLFIANLKAGVHAGNQLFMVLLTCLKPVMLALIKVYNAFAPIITLTANVMTAMIYTITSNAAAVKLLASMLAGAAAMWIVFKAKAMASLAIVGVVKVIAKSLAGLASVLTFLAVHPFWSLLMLLVGVTVGLSGGFNKLSESINSVFKGMSGLNGVKADKVLLPESKDRANDLNKFNESLDATKDGLSDTEDKAKKAAKALKGLLSFDEVFKLDKGSGGTDADEKPAGEEFETPDLSGLGGLGGALIPEIPDFKGFVDLLTTDLIDTLKEGLLGAGLGALIGGLLGGILGGPLAAKIGAIAGAIAGWFWKDVADALGLTDIGKVAIPIAAGLGAVIGACIGGPWGAVIGAGIGTLVGWLIDSIARGLETGDWSNMGYPIGIGLGAAIGALMGGPMGAALGAGIGLLVGKIFDQLTTGLTTGVWDFSGLGYNLGLGIGGAIGLVMGGPAGAIVGAAVGALVGWLVGLIVDNWSSITDWFSSVWTDLTTFFSSVGTSVGQFFAGLGKGFDTGWNSLVEGVGTFFSSASKHFSEGLSNIRTWCSDMMNTISTGTAQWFAPIGSFFDTAMSGLATFASDLVSDMSLAFSDVSLAISTVMSDIFKAISTVWDDVLSAFSVVGSALMTTTTNVFTFISDFITRAFTIVWESVCSFFSPIAASISSTCSLASTAVSIGFTAISTSIQNMTEAAWGHVTAGYNKILATITEKVTAAHAAVTKYFSDIAQVISTKLIAAGTTVSTTFQAMCSTITSWLTNAYNIVTSSFGNINTTIANSLARSYESVRHFFSSMYEAMRSNISNMYDTVRDGIGNIYRVFTNWVSDMWSNVFSKLFKWIDDAISKLRDFFSMNEKAANTPVHTPESPAPKSTQTGKPAAPKPAAPKPKAPVYKPSGLPTIKKGHATGGVFNREHVARFAEGNKAEAVIPLENSGAMKPFVDAVADGITASLMPILSMLSNMSGSQSGLQPVYVGTLIADDNGLKELHRKMQIISIKEERRGGNG